MTAPSDDRQESTRGGGGRAGLDRARRSLCAGTLDPFKADFILRYAKQGNVLDLGAGNGLYGRTMFDAGREVLQIDIEDRRDKAARHVPFLSMDVQHLALVPSTYDNVIAFDVMEHLQDDAGFLSEVRKVCRGRLLLSVPNSEDEQVRGIGLTHLHHTDKSHVREYSEASLDTLLQEAGFTNRRFFARKNSCILAFARALARRSWLGRVAARLITLQCGILVKVGVFENRCIADWFVVAE